MSDKSGKRAHLVMMNELRFDSSSRQNCSLGAMWPLQSKRHCSERAGRIRTARARLTNLLAIMTAHERTPSSCTSTNEQLTAQQRGPVIARASEVFALR